MKAYLKGQVISYCASKKKMVKEWFRNLTDEIQHVDWLYSRSPFAHLFQKRISLKIEFDILSTKQAEYLIYKTWSHYCEHGGKAGRVLAHQLCQKSANQTITAINDESSLKYTDSKGIPSCFSQFYQSLHTSKPPTNSSELETFFKTLYIPSVSSELSTQLERDLSVTEITSTIRNMQSGKCPGPDGFPAEIWKKFSDLLSPLLLLVFKEAIPTKSLPFSMHQAVISLLLKQDKDLLSCGSYHPISLLNIKW